MANLNKRFQVLQTFSQTVVALAAAVLLLGCGPLEPHARGARDSAAAARPAPSTAALNQDFGRCPQFFAGGRAPAVAIGGRLRALCFDNFAVLHSGETRTPVYVAERLNREILLKAKTVQRHDRFFADARLPSGERADLDDYRGSGFARGHMAPAADMPTDQAMAQSFSLANMVPQDPRQNSGPWARVEEDTRKYVMRAQGDVHVITGPVFADQRTIGRNGVRVPSHLFKLVYDPATGRAWAHWQQNRPDAKVNKPLSYAAFQQWLNLDLLPGVKVR